MVLNTSADSGAFCSAFKSTGVSLPGLTALIFSLSTGEGINCIIESASSFTPRLFKADPQKTGTNDPSLIPSCSPFSNSSSVKSTPSKNLFINSSLDSATASFKAFLISSTLSIKFAGISISDILSLSNFFAVIDTRFTYPINLPFSVMGI
ncbi:MAG: hypothetical protein BWY74_00969 [Firmicutes bacterium ADurb.Bin419]|nr:MAG: hypothetical protein BWY74_00969 [Firmicutes bacterium ADurb.Bin419]